MGCPGGGTLLSTCHSISLGARFALSIFKALYSAPYPTPCLASAASDPAQLELLGMMAAAPGSNDQHEAKGAWSSLWLSHGCLCLTLEPAGMEPSL